MAKPKTPTERAVDYFSDSVESLLIALAQRKMTRRQVDRLAGILQRAERDVLARSTSLPAKDRRRADAA